MTYTPVEQDLRKLRKTSIESAGEQVMNHLLELLKTTDLSCPEMAKRLNEIYTLKITRHDIYRFFRKNTEVLGALKSEQDIVKKLRSDILLDHITVLTKDIRVLDSELDKLTGDEGTMIEPDKRAKVIGDLIDKKGKLLLREARLSGKIGAGRDGGDTFQQINVYNEANQKKSELIMKLKKFEAAPKVIDVAPEDVKVEAEVQ